MGHHTHFHIASCEDGYSDSGVLRKVDRKSKRWRKKVEKLEKDQGAPKSSDVRFELTQEGFKCRREAGGAQRAHFARLPTRAWRVQKKTHVKRMTCRTICRTWLEQPVFVTRPFPDIPRPVPPPDSPKPTPAPPSRQPYALPPPPPPIARPAFLPSPPPASTDSMRPATPPDSPRPVPPPDSPRPVPPPDSPRPAPSVMEEK